jgi:hypothetical protein
LGFVALNPTYFLPLLLRIAKPNNGRFRNQAPKVSFLTKPAVFLADGWAGENHAFYGNVSYDNQSHFYSSIAIKSWFNGIKTR